MKKLITLITILTLIGCEKESINEGCECSKETYELVSWITTDSNGNLHLNSRFDLLYNEPVLCQDEVTQYTPIGELYFKVNCN